MITGVGVNVQEQAGPAAELHFMSKESSALPVFATSAPAVFCDPDVTAGLFAQVRGRLAELVDIDPDQLQRPTPCAGFTVGELRRHVLGWLEFFAAALSDPMATTPRADPEAFADPAASAATACRMSVKARATTSLAGRPSASWDLATSTGQAYSVPDAAVLSAHTFLRQVVAPDHRGPDSGFWAWMMYSPSAMASTPSPVARHRDDDMVTISRRGGRRARRRPSTGQAARLRWS